MNEFELADYERLKAKEQQMKEKEEKLKMARKKYMAKYYKSDKGKLQIKKNNEKRAKGGKVGRPPKPMTKEEKKVKRREYYLKYKQQKLDKKNKNIDDNEN